MPSDSDYLEAVNSGDTAAAQRMVDEAAKAAGYTVGPVYHGTPTGGFNVFDKAMRGETSGVSRRAFSFTTNKKAAESYSKSLGNDAVRLDAGLRVVNNAMRKFDTDQPTLDYFDSKGYQASLYEALPEFDWGSIDDIPEFIKELRGYAKDLKDINPELSKDFLEGAKVMTQARATPEVKRVFLRIPENAPVFQATPKTVGMVMRDFSAEAQPTKSGIVELPDNERIYYVADPEQIKSADPITRDDQGNVIPLSQRFQTSSADIRFMPEETTIYRAGDKTETGVKAFSSWSESKSTAEAYLDNPGFGGAVLRSEKVPLNRVLDADTTSRKGMERLARQLGFDEGTGDKWFDNGWRYPWEESKSIKEALKKSGFDAIRYPDDFPEGATSIVPLKDFSASENNRFMPTPDSSMPGAYSFTGGYRALPGKSKGSLRIYSPAGSLIGIAASLDEAQRIIRRKAQQ